MHLRPFRWRSVLALIVAYVVAIQGVGSAFGSTLPSFGSTYLSHLCSGVVAAGDPVRDHDGDHCKIACASGACGHGVPVAPSESTSDALFSKPLTFVSVPRGDRIADHQFAAFARGPPSSSV